MQIKFGERIRTARKDCNLYLQEPGRLIVIDTSLLIKRGNGLRQVIKEPNLNLPNVLKTYQLVQLVKDEPTAVGELKTISKNTKNWK